MNFGAGGDHAVTNNKVRQKNDFCFAYWSFKKDMNKA